MSDDYTSLGTLRYGSTELSLATYRAKTTPIIDQSLGRTGTNYEVEAEGEIDGTDGDDFATNLGDASANLSIDGQDLVITGIGGATEFEILAATCLYGGPHVSFELRETITPLRKKIVIRITTDTPLTASDSSGDPTNLYKSNTERKADDLQVVTWTGTVSGANTVSYFLTKVVQGKFRAMFPLPKWAIDVKYDLVDNNSRPPLPTLPGGSGGGTTAPAAAEQIQYTITATQMYGVLPAPSGATYAVDGNVTFRKERDEKMRLTETLDINLLVVGDPVAMATWLRPSGEGVVVLKESMQIETVRENRLIASFVVLKGGDGNELMDFTQTIEFTPPTDQWEMQQFESTAAILVKKPQTIGTAVQSGMAIAAGKWLTPPPPLFVLQAVVPRKTFQFLNEVERQTSWSYTMYLFDPQAGAMSEDQIAHIQLEAIARATGGGAGFQS